VRGLVKKPVVNKQIIGGKLRRSLGNEANGQCTATGKLLGEDRSGGKIPEGFLCPREGPGPACVVNRRKSRRKGQPGPAGLSQSVINVVAVPSILTLGEL